MTTLFDEPIPVQDVDDAPLRSDQCPKCRRLGYHFDRRARAMMCLYRDCFHSETRLVLEASGIHLLLGGVIVATVGGGANITLKDCESMAERLARGWNLID